MKKEANQSTNEVPGLGEDKGEVVEVVVEVEVVEVVVVVVVGVVVVVCLVVVVFVVDVVTPMNTYISCIQSGLS